MLSRVGRHDPICAVPADARDAGAVAYDRGAAPAAAAARAAGARRALGAVRPGAADRTGPGRYRHHRTRSRLARAARRRRPPLSPRLPCRTARRDDRAVQRRRRVGSRAIPAGDDAAADLRHRAVRHADAGTIAAPRPQSRRLSVRHDRDRRPDRGGGARRDGRYDGGPSGGGYRQAGLADDQGRTGLALEPRGPVQPLVSDRPPVRAAAGWRLGGRRRGPSSRSGTGACPWTCNRPRWSRFPGANCSTS